MQLRLYQRQAVNKVLSFFRNGTGNPIIAMPTGTGKSFVIAELLRLAQTLKDRKCLVTTHAKELILQNKEKYELLSGNKAGVYSASVGQRDTINPVIFCGIASVYKKADLFNKITLLIIDECHLVNDKSNTMYARFISDLLKINPELKIIGLSATPYRLGFGLLTEGKIFTDICVDMTTPYWFKYFLKEGYIKPLVVKRAKLTYPEYIDKAAILNLVNYKIEST